MYMNSDEIPIIVGKKLLYAVKKQAEPAEADRIPRKALKVAVMTAPPIIIYPNFHYISKGRSISR